MQWMQLRRMLLPVHNTWPSPSFDLIAQDTEMGDFIFHQKNKIAIFAMSNFRHKCQKF